MTAPDLGFIAGLPKVELHVHHVGAAPLRVIADLAERYAASTAVPSDPDALARYFTFTDFEHFIDIYLSVTDLVRTADDVALLTYEVARELAAQNVRYCELTLTPHLSVQRGIAAQDYCAAIEDARRRADRDFGLQLRWSFDIPAEDGLPGAAGTLAVALEQQPAGLVSFGLGGPEIGVTREQLKPYFDQARAAGLRSVPHAGESTDAQSIWDAIHFLGAQRIGHGIRAIDDPQLIDYLVEQRLPLEVCPTSNFCTGSVPSLAEHPLPALVSAGVTVSINSDDPTMFATTLSDEYAIAAGLLELDVTGVAELARSAIRCSFLDAAHQAVLLAEIDDYLATHAIA